MTGSTSWKASNKARAFERKHWGTLAQRYTRAVRLTAPKIAVETPGAAVDGYWIDNNHYFFLHEEAGVGARGTFIPFIFNRESGQSKAVIPSDKLAALLAGRAPRPLDLKALSNAEFAIPEVDTLAVSVAGTHYLIDLRHERVIEAHELFAEPAIYSPNGCYACFVKGADVWLRDCDTGATRPLTTDGAPRRRYAQQPECAPTAGPGAQGSAPVGLWSPDSAWFLTHRIEEPALPDSALIRHAPPGGGRPVIGRFIYPIPGDPLPTATYLAIHIASGHIVAFDQWPVPVTVISPISLHGAWFGAQNTAWIVRVDRYYRTAELIRFDLTAGSGRVTVRESTDAGYLDLHSNVLVTPNIRTLRGSAEVVWFSERDGWGHLYLYDADTGILKNRITRGEWLVRDIVHVDEKNRKILFLAGGLDRDKDPARRTLCSINMDGGGFEALLSHDGDVFVPVTDPVGEDQSRRFHPSYIQPGISPDGRFAVVRYASVDRGNRTEIVDLANRRGTVVAQAVPPPDAVPPKHFTALAADGVTRLYGVMFFPSDFDTSRRYPLVDYIYAGPHTQHQPQSFRSVNAAPAMSLAELGTVTIMLDTRGIPTRSKAFHQIGYGELLEPHLADHATVARQLCEQHSFIDPERIGMIGYSAGGAATARALLVYGDVFKVGISVCGNHDSNLLSVFMSDKYRGPGSRESWARQANTAAAHKLEGKLLLMSSDVDTCVHVGHTLQLVDALIRANRDFDLVIVPNEGHDMLLTSGYVQRRAWDFVVRHLLDKTPPPQFEIRLEPHEVVRYQRTYAREQRQ